MSYLLQTQTHVLMKYYTYDHCFYAVLHDPSSDRPHDLFGLTTPSITTVKKESREKGKDIGKKKQWYQPFSRFDKFLTWFINYKDY